MSILKRKPKAAAPAPVAPAKPPVPAPAPVPPKASVPRPQPPKPAAEPPKTPPKASVPRPAPAPRPQTPAPIAEKPKPDPQPPLTPPPLGAVVGRVPPRKKYKIKPVENRNDYKTLDDYVTLFNGRGKDSENPVPVDIFYAYFPPVYYNGHDLPNDLWVQNAYGIIYKFIGLGGHSRTNIVRAGNLPKLDMNFLDGEL